MQQFPAVRLILRNIIRCMSPPYAFSLASVMGDVFFCQKYDLDVPHRHVTNSAALFAVISLRYFRLVFFDRLDIQLVTILFVMGPFLRVCVGCCFHSPERSSRCSPVTFLELNSFVLRICWAVFYYSLYVSAWLPFTDQTIV